MKNVGVRDDYSPADSAEDQVQLALQIADE